MDFEDYTIYRQEKLGDVTFPITVEYRALQKIYQRACNENFGRVEWNLDTWTRYFISVSSMELLRRLAEE